MTDIFNEIEEDLRRDRMRRIWDRFGGLFIGLALLVVVGTGAWSGYKYWRQQAAETASAQFETASTLAAEGKLAEAEAAYGALAKDGPSGYGVIARFRAAAVAAERDKAAGIAAFDALAADGTLSAAVRDVARVRAGLLLVDSAPLDQVRERLAAVADGSGPMRNAAREVMALALLKAGDQAAANAAATRITEDAEATGGERSRAELIRRLTASAVPVPNPVPPAAAGPGTPATQ